MPGNKKMSNDYLQIEIDGEEIDTLYTDLVRLEVELDDEMAGSFRLRLCMVSALGNWTNLDDEHIAVWKPISINAGFQDNYELLLDGFITQIRPDFGTDPEEAILDIWGMDKSVLLDRIEKLKDWPAKKDSDIATEIFQEYGLTPQVETTDVVHEEVASTVIQRETDMQFLKRLALRNGFHCYVQGETGVFGSVDLAADPQPLLSIHFGNQTNASKFKVTVDGMAPASIGMYQLDRTTKEVHEVNINASTLDGLGDTDSSGILAQGMDPGQVFVGRNSTSGNEEMNSLCQGLYHQADWFISAEAEIHANDYNHVMMPRKTITVRGVGEKLSGLYYVHQTKHIFTSDGYTQTIMLRRNGLFQTGAESFETGGLLSVAI